MANMISRRDFLKKSAVGVLSLALVGKLGLDTVHAATVTDNLNSAGIHRGTSAPADTNMGWIDTGNSGVMKYWDGTKWTPIRSTWDE